MSFDSFNLFTFGKRHKSVLIRPDQAVMFIIMLSDDHRDGDQPVIELLT